MMPVDARVRRLALIAVAGGLVMGCAGARPDWTAGPVPSQAATVAPSPAATVAPSPAATIAPSPAATIAPSPAASIAGSPAASAGQVLAVTARDLSFTPRDLAADSGAAVTLTLTNDGRIVHNLTIDELGVQIVASPGKTVSTSLADVPAGTYTFYCSVSGHRQAGMFGTLTVR